jgi:hypothetical protein
MADSDPNTTTTPNIASPEGAYPNYYSPAEIPKLVQFLTSMSGGGMPGGAPVNHNDTANQFIQWIHPWPVAAWERQAAGLVVAVP